jgi:hypothetical protein
MTCHDNKDDIGKMAIGGIGIFQQIHAGEQ